MTISYTASFQKRFKKRIVFNAKLVRQFENRLVDLKSGNDGFLKVHALTGSKRGLYAFSVTGDIRVIFQKVSDEEIILIDIGSHNQVY